MRPLFLIALFIFLAACNQSPQETASAPVKTPAEPPPPTSRWEVSTSRNDLTGEITTTAANGFGDAAIIIRLVGKKLDCYVRTGKFLETIDNLDSRRSSVKYKFDDGNIVQQEWIISDRNTALFYPGDARSFIQKLRKAKRFVIEYKPADVIPQTESFDVSLFPSEIVDALGLKSMPLEVRGKTRNYNSTFATKSVEADAIVPQPQTSSGQGPSLLFRVEPEYTEEARTAKWQGTVVLSLVVDDQGRPQNLKIVRALGLGLDQKAIEAVEKWKFKPGMKDGRPVTSAVTIEVNFRLP